MLLTISVTVIAAFIVIFVCFLIPVLLQIRRTSQKIEKLADAVLIHVEPLGRDLTFISTEVRDLLQSIRRQVDTVEEGFLTVREAALSLKAFQLGVRQILEVPLLELSSLVRGVTQGLEAFLRIFRR